MSAAAIDPKSLPVPRVTVNPWLIAIVVALDHWRARTRGWDTALLAASLALAIYFYPVLAALPLPAAVDQATAHQVGGLTAGFGLRVDRDGERDLRELVRWILSCGDEAASALPGVVHAARAEDRVVGAIRIGAIKVGGVVDGVLAGARTILN